MKKMKKLFFDTEFTGLQQNTTLISIGIVSDCGKTFYAEFTDFDKHQCGDWIITNVLSKLLFKNKPNTNLIISNKKSEFTVKGNSFFVQKCLLKWLEQFDDVEFWSDCLSYDWVLFNELFGGALNLPKTVYYIPFDICTLFKVKGIDPDISREGFVSEKKSSEKHNSLFDAIIIKKCFEKLMI